MPKGEVAVLRCRGRGGQAAHSASGGPVQGRGLSRGQSAMIGDSFLVTTQAQSAQRAEAKHSETHRTLPTTEHCPRSPGPRSSPGLQRSLEEGAHVHGSDEFSSHGEDTCAAHTTPRAQGGQHVARADHFPSASRVPFGDEALGRTRPRGGQTPTRLSRNSGPHGLGGRRRPPCKVAPRMVSPSAGQVSLSNPS